MPAPDPQPGFLSRLRQDLGTVESYAALVGILVGAGIFRVTSDAYAATGPSVVLGYLALAPVVLATSVAYVVFLSTPLGRGPGGEYTHVSRTFGGSRLAFLGAWLKLISYLGAASFLAVVFADYSIELVALAGAQMDPDRFRTPLALAALTFFWIVNVVGARWFGRLQVAMCAGLGIAIVVLVVPGLFAIETENYRPFFTQGGGGFARSLFPLFFAYAGFESVAHSAGEVRDSQRRLPRVFLRGIVLATLIFVAMSAVALGTLPADRVAASRAPMAEAAATYLPVGATAFVTVGALLAVATSLNATLFVPARLGLMLAHDELLPRWLGVVNSRTGAPVAGLTASFVCAALLTVSGQTGLALGIAILACLLVYALHDVALLALPYKAPELYAQRQVRVPLIVQRSAAVVSLLALGGTIVVQAVTDAGTVQATTLAQRVAERSLTSFELLAAWLVAGLVVYRLMRRRAR